MTVDLGLQGLGILLALSLGFGVIAHFVAARATTPWLWLIAAAGSFVGGLFASEVMFATYTEGEIQPIIDGLAFDEALLGSLIGGVAVVLATWLATRRGRTHGPMST